MPGVVYTLRRCQTAVEDANNCCAKGDGSEVKPALSNQAPACCGDHGTAPYKPRLIPRPPTNCADVKRPVRASSPLKDSTVQTDCVVELLPGAPNEKATMTGRSATVVPHHHDTCYSPQPPPSPPRRMMSVQPPRACSCLCHMTALRRSTPHATSTYMAEAEARLTGCVTERQPETEATGKGQLCWRCRMQQCYQCGVEIPDYRTYRQPTLRVGRLGAPWRHVKGVTTNNGVYFSFVDGVVKVDDTKYYPPYGYIPGSTGQQARRPICLCGGCKNCVCAKKVLTGSSYYDHAKNGFRYWFDDHKPKRVCSPDCCRSKPRYLKTWC